MQNTKDTNGVLTKRKGIKMLRAISDAVWGMPTVLLIVLAGLYFSLKTGFVQLRAMPEALRFARRELRGGTSAYRAIASSLAATVGTGSITGVATALTLGGAGAVFWLWVSAFFGMAVSYAEGVLSIKYSIPDGKGKKGGIMYALSLGLKKPAAAWIYAALTVAASFGMGSMAQVNSASSALESELSVPTWATAAVIAVFAGACLFSGKDLGAKFCSVFLPLISVGYVAASVWLICSNIDALPSAFEQIFCGAFGIRQFAGGTAGYAVKTALSTGFKRGVFSNEAGLGTTAAIHAESGCKTAREQGLMNMLEVVIDTFVICTLTALGILSSGAAGSGLDGAELVIAAFKTCFYDSSGIVVAVIIASFAAATVIGWSKIGSAAFDYLVSGCRMNAHNAKYGNAEQGNTEHDKSRPKKTLAEHAMCAVYPLMFCTACFLGGVTRLDTAWQLSDIFNGLMVLPCMLALIGLRKEIIFADHVPARRKRPSRSKVYRL